MPRLHIGKRSPSDVVETYCSISVQAPNVIVTIFPALIAAIPAADPTYLAMSHVKKLPRVTIWGAVRPKRVKTPL